MGFRALEGGRRARGCHRCRGGPPWYAAAVLKLGVVVAVVIALGQPARAEEDAAALAERGLAAYGLGRYAEAAEAYERAYAARPEAQYLYRAARAWEDGGARARAVVLYQNYLKLFPDGEHRSDVARRLGVPAEAEAAPGPAATAAAPAAAPAPAASTAAPAPAVAPAPAPARAALGNAPEPPRKKRVTERPWFWGVVGGAVVLAVGVGIVLSVTVGTPDPTPTFGTAKVQ